MMIAARRGVAWQGSEKRSMDFGRSINYLHNHLDRLGVARPGKARQGS